MSLHPETCLGGQNPLQERKGAAFKVYDLSAGTADKRVVMAGTACDEPALSAGIVDAAQEAESLEEGRRAVNRRRANAFPLQRLRGLWNRQAPCLPLEKPPDRFPLARETRARLSEYLTQFRGRLFVLHCHNDKAFSA
jgi:hypothetical protein